MTIFKATKRSYSIKENAKSWTITSLDTPEGISVTTKLSKEDYATLDDVKSFILESLEVYNG